MNSYWKFQHRSVNPLLEIPKKPYGGDGIHPLPPPLVLQRVKGNKDYIYLQIDWKGVLQSLMNIEMMRGEYL